MILVLKGHERFQHQSLFDQMFRLRREIFVDKRGWSLPIKGDREIDQYDVPEAAYFFDIDHRGTITSTLRMTPTSTSSLLADLYPHLVERDVPLRSETIWETTRYIIRRAPEQSYRQAKGQMLTALVEWCQDQGLSFLHAVIDAAMLPSFVAVTLQTDPLGLAHPYSGGLSSPGGGECLAFRWPINQAVRNDCRSYGGFVTSDQAPRMWSSTISVAA